MQSLAFGNICKQLSKQKLFKCGISSLWRCLDCMYAVHITGKFSQQCTEKVEIWRWLNGHEFKVTRFVKKPKDLSSFVLEILEKSKCCTAHINYPKIMQRNRLTTMTLLNIAAHRLNRYTTCQVFQMIIITLWVAVKNQPHLSISYDRIHDYSYISSIKITELKCSSNLLTVEYENTGTMLWCQIKCISITFDKLAQPL